ncbi:MAG: DUF6516 family protein [Bdellovibrionota bacterium]|mgnify:CR=1 FL=1
MGQRSRAELVIHEKLTSSSGLVREIRVWKMRKSGQYPQGIRYRLALVNCKSGELYLLYDNHWPKGPHVHFDGRETVYSFESVVALLIDFRDRADAVERQVR